MHDEDRFQTWCMEYVKAAHPSLKVIHIPNGGSRNVIEASKLKRMGVLAGVCDLLFILPIGKVFWCELKASKGRISPSQRAFMADLDRLEHNYAVCWNQDDFIALCKKLSIAT